MAVIDQRDEDLRMLRIDQVLELFPISKVSLYRLIREKKFPAPEKIGGTSVWASEDLREWRQQSRQRKTASSAPRRRDASDLI